MIKKSTFLSLSPKFAASVAILCTAITASAVIIPGDAATYASSGAYPAATASHTHDSGGAAAGSFSTGEEERGVVKFDIQALSVIGNATLNFVVGNGGGPYGQSTGNFDVRVVGYHGSALGDVMADYSAPSTGVITSFALTSTPTGTAFSVDVTELVRAAKQANVVAFGVRFEATTNPGDHANRYFNGVTLDVTEERPADDRVENPAGGTTIYPLANDPVSMRRGTISQVSEQTVTINPDGRSLSIPEGYVGTFTYTVGEGAEGTVEVLPGTAIGAPSQYNGLLYDGEDQLVGWARVSISARGLGSLRVRHGSQMASASFGFPVSATSATVALPFGVVQIERNPDGTVLLTLNPEAENEAGGTLRAARTSATVAKYHIALESTDGRIPGGGYAIMGVRSRGTVAVTGILPDGRPFSASTSISANGTTAFYTPLTRGVVPPGHLAGEFVNADLERTDLTGELVWVKPPQTGGLGSHRDGVNARLTANGSIYARDLTGFDGPATLSVAGSYFAEPESVDVSVSGAVPAVAGDGSVRGWSRVRPDLGRFTASVSVPGSSRPVNASGIYIPKMRLAIGYIPHPTIGGRVVLQMTGRGQLPR